VEWRDDCKRDFGPWFKSRKSLISFFLMDDGQKMVDKLDAAATNSNQIW